MVSSGPSVVFTNVINPRAEFEKKDQFKSTIIKKGVTLGANSTITVVLRYILCFCWSWSYCYKR